MARVAAEDSCGFTKAMARFPSTPLTSIGNKDSPALRDRYLRRPQHFTAIIKDRVSFIYTFTQMCKLPQETLFKLKMTGIKYFTSVFTKMLLTDCQMLELIAVISTRCTVNCCF